ncbi:hypothetical protein LshimejAT787_1103700 [Lyophyllum shimeji]|uniref:Uncharacterized protein n=1 Tax=Lyophyllum shimeji TaxID=47721 RepID=A0A9P3USD8_LYOSH|nr:hypothetical protein LshimejAT787_1103700 [Lyophyllum shimeji]
MPDDLVKEQDMSNLDNLQSVQCIPGSESASSTEDAEKRSPLDNCVLEKVTKSEAVQTAPAPEKDDRLDDQLEEQVPLFPGGRPRGRVNAPTSAAKPEPTKPTSK